MIRQKTSRYDAFIIWGNGLKYAEKILSKLRSSPGIEILRIEKFYPKNIEKFIDDIYSIDPVPLEHLKAKTEYLRKSHPEIIVIFVINKKPDEQMVGEGEFKHIQCMTIKNIKEGIRNQYNPRLKSGHRSEEHVIHASDYESQTDHILKIIGHDEGIELFSKKSNLVLNAPHHLTVFNKFRIRRINLSQLRASIITGPPDSISLRQTKLADTPHFQFLAGSEDSYRKYIQKYGGIILVDDHYAEAFQKLSLNFKYLGPGFETSYIIVKPLEKNRLLIVDGLHRAVLQLHFKFRDVLVAEVLP